jgi:hypothetical protein
MLINPRTKKRKTCLIVAMMTSKKIMKEMPKHKKVIPDDPRIGIGINTLPEPSGFKQEAKFNEFHPLEIAALTSTAANRKFGRIDDDLARTTLAQHQT